MRTSGDDIAEVLALLGVRPEWDEASRRVSDLHVVPLEELGRPRIDVTVRISGFFRDAFPHVVAMLDDAVRLVAGLDEPLDQQLRARPRPGRPRRARRRAPGDDADLRLQARVVRRRHPAGRSSPARWRDDEDLAEVYTAWGGFAYGRELDGAPAADDMRANYRRIKVAAKNIDTREHDIADTDDYFQYHGGMVATVRALTGADPKAYVGDSTTPDAVRTRTLQEETNRVFRARVVNPRWIGAMQRHGYKGAFELAATVDYLFGFDATAGVVHDWMYEALAQGVRPRRDQPGVHEAARTRGRCAGSSSGCTRPPTAGCGRSPTRSVLAAMQQVYLELEGDLEDRVRQVRIVGDRDGAAPGHARGRGRAARSPTTWSPRRRRDGDALLAIRREIADAFGVPVVAVPDPARDREPVGDGGYAGAVADWHAARVAAYEAVLAARQGDRGLPGLGRPGVLRLHDPDRARRSRSAARSRSSYDVVPGHHRAPAARRAAPDRAARGRPAAARHHRPPAARGDRRRARTTSW